MSFCNNPHTKQARIKESTGSRFWAAPTRELKHHNRGKLGQRQQQKNEIQSGGLDALLKTTASWNYSFGTKNPRRNRTGPRAGTCARTRTEDRAAGSEPEAEREVQD
jgi:hypothetical protein